MEGEGSNALAFAQMIEAYFIVAAADGSPRAVYTNKDEASADLNAGDGGSVMIAINLANGRILRMRRDASGELIRERIVGSMTE